jgi:hypothetical protein
VASINSISRLLRKGFSGSSAFRFARSGCRRASNPARLLTR